MLTEYLLCKVADFGVSRYAEADTTMTVTGTPAWLAPEVMSDQMYDHKADVWSFGLILWELATHQIPYSDDESANCLSAFQLMNAIVNQKVTPSTPQSMPSPAISSIFEVCCRFVPQERLDMDDALSMLRQVEESGQLADLQKSSSRRSSRNSFKL